MSNFIGKLLSFIRTVYSLIMSFFKMISYLIRLTYKFAIILVSIAVIFIVIGYKLNNFSFVYYGLLFILSSYVILAIVIVLSFYYKVISNKKLHEFVDGYSEVVDEFLDKSKLNPSKKEGDPNAK